MPMDRAERQALEEERELWLNANENPLWQVLYANFNMAYEYFLRQLRTCPPEEIFIIRGRLQMLEELSKLPVNRLVEIEEDLVTVKGESNG